jgi:short-subunit dehydrogenase
VRGKHRDPRGWGWRKHIRIGRVRRGQQRQHAAAVARNEAKLKSLLSELGAGHSHLVADLSTVAGQDLVAAELGRAPYDLLINNAGVGTTGSFTDVPVERQLAMLRLNCEAVVKLSHAFLSRAKAGDALLNVSSTLAFTPMPGFGLYCATKSFVTTFSESLWFEQSKRGVFVMDLCPGITATNFQVAAGGKQEDLPKGLSQTPEQVVDVAWDALRARAKPTVISGPKNKVFASLSRVMSRKRLVSTMGRMMPPS